MIKFLRGILCSFIAALFVLQSASYAHTPPGSDDEGEPSSTHNRGSRPGSLPAVRSLSQSGEDGEIHDDIEAVELHTREGHGSEPLLSAVGASYSTSARSSLDIGLASSDEEDPRHILPLLGRIMESLRSESYNPVFSFWELPPLLGLITGIPLSQFAVKKAGDSLALKIYFTGSTIVSVGLTRVWAIDALINEEWRGGRGRSIGSHAAVNILSLLSALPLTYMVWKKNGVAFALIQFVSEWSLSTLGFYKVSDKILKTGPSGNLARRGYRELEVDLDNPDLISKTYRYVLKQNEPDNLVVQLVERNASLEQIQSEIEASELPWPRAKKATKLSFYIFPLATVFVNGILSYNSITEFTSSPFLVVPYLVLTTLPTTALQAYTTSSSVDDLWGDTINLRAYHRAKSRKTYFSVAISSIVLSFGSSMWANEVVGEALSETFLKNLVPLFVITTVAQVVIFESHGVREYIARKYYRFKELSGSAAEKTLTKFIHVCSGINESLQSHREEGYAWYNPLGWFQKIRRCCQS